MDGVSRAALVALLVAVGCGASGLPRVSSPMSARDSEVFDSAVDYVERPSSLGGSWADGASNDLTHRVTAGDVVASVVVRAVRSDSDASGRRTRRVAVQIEEPLVGDAGSRELSLPVGENEAGFDTVAGHDAQLLERRFVLFLKWAADPAGTVVPRWHLSPASEEIRADVRRAVRQRSGEGNGT